MVSRCGTVNCVRVACVTAKSVWYFSVQVHVGEPSVEGDQHHYLGRVRVSLDLLVKIVVLSFKVQD